MSIYRMAAVALALGLFAWAAGSAAAEEKKDLKVGDKAPRFESVDDQGKPWKSADHVGKKVVVIYFYPADLTGGCTKQACAYRDDLGKLNDKGVAVVGVSADSADNHQVFKKAHKLNFTLLADEKGDVAKKFGVPFSDKAGQANVKDEEGNAIVLKRAGTASRWTFVIGKDGTIIHKDTKVNAAQDSKKILEVIEKQDK